MVGPPTGACRSRWTARGFKRTHERGRYLAPPGECRLAAVRRDGLLYARGEELTVYLTAGATEYVQLQLRNARTGGVGVRFRPEADGMRVVAVVPGSSAWDAGLEVGDLIVGVGGEPVAGMGSEDFVGRMTGPEGSEVEFTVEFRTDDGITDETVRVERRYLEG